MESVYKSPEGEETPPFNNRILKMTRPLQGRVLIVEDENELAEVLEFNLIRNGYEVLIARDGLEACRVIGREKPDLILLDLMLPLLDGWEVCRMLRTHQDPLVARTPVIMLSALGSADDRLKGYGSGADHYLPKPYAMKEVLFKSRQLIEQNHEYLSLFEKISTLEKWHSLQDNWQHVLFHELKNQLTIISGMAQGLTSKGGLQREHSRQYAHHIQQSSDYLSSLAMSYMLVRQVERNPGQLSLEPLLVQYLFAELRELFSPLAEQNFCQIEFECAALPALELHPVGLKIVLSSLIDNALKYTGQAGQVKVVARMTAQDYEILVEDDGPGIAAGEREKIFEKFYRGESESSAPPGSGLGLYMARVLAESMGGRLTLESSPRPGSHFCLCFPRN